MQNSFPISNIYRFALVLTKSHIQAASLVEEAVREVADKSGEISRSRMNWLIFQKVRRKALCQASQKKVGEAAQDFLAALYELPEPSRSAITLLCLESFSLRDLESFLGLSTEQLAEALRIARTALKDTLPTLIPMQSSATDGTICDA